MFVFASLSAYLAEDFLISQTSKRFQAQVFFLANFDNLDSTANTAAVFLPIVVLSAMLINPQRA